MQWVQGVEAGRTFHGWGALGFVFRTVAGDEGSQCWGRCHAELIGQGERFSCQSHTTPGQAADIPLPQDSVDGRVNVGVTCGAQADQRRLHRLTRSAEPGFRADVMRVENRGAMAAVHGALLHLYDVVGDSQGGGDFHGPESSSPVPWIGEGALSPYGILRVTVFTPHIRNLS